MEWVEVLAVTGWVVAWAVMAEEDGSALMRAGTDINNLQSLQRGARNFMNYCSGCHSLQYLRYNRIGTDLKIPPAELQAPPMLYRVGMLLVDPMFATPKNRRCQPRLRPG